VLSALAGQNKQDCGQTWLVASYAILKEYMQRIDDEN